jgi:hypothetical protein
MLGRKKTLTFAARVWVWFYEALVEDPLSHEERKHMAADELDAELKKLQQGYIAKAIIIGQVRKTVDYTRRILAEFSQGTTITYPIGGVVGSTGNLFISLASEAKQAHAAAKNQDAIIDGIASGAQSAYFAVDSLVGLMPKKWIQEKLPERAKSEIVWNEEQTGGAAKRFYQLDVELGKEYEQLKQIELGTYAEPSRPMMFLARQLFDHAISLLVSDSEVKVHLKITDETAKVTRRQRLETVVLTKVREKARADTLLNEVATILETYEVLNEAHTRGELDSDRSMKAAKAMTFFLERLISEIRP